MTNGFGPKHGQTESASTTTERETKVAKGQPRVAHTKEAPSDKKDHLRKVVGATEGEGKAPGNSQKGVSAADGSSSAGLPSARVPGSGVVAVYSYTFCRARIMAGRSIGRYE